MERIARSIISLTLTVILIAVTGCSSRNLVITTGFDKTELMRINDTSTFLPEYMLYLTTVQNQYEQVYGEDLWGQEYGAESLETRVKDKVIAELAQVKVMNLMAMDYGLSFSQSEEEKITRLSDKFYESLNEDEIEVIKLTPEICRQACAEYAMARKVYEFIIKDVNPEISDDEARTVTILQIFIKNYTEDAAGRHVPYSDRMLQEAKEKVSLAYSLTGEKDASFESIQAKFNEGEETVRTIARGALDKPLEEAVFNLSNGEVSEVIETEDGYYILKCISDFDIDETQKNKVKLLEAEKEQVFDDTYNRYLASITKSLNQNLYDSITLIHNDNVKTMDFFEIMK